MKEKEITMTIQNSTASIAIYFDNKDWEHTRNYHIDKMTKKMNAFLKKELPIKRKRGDKILKTQFVLIPLGQLEENNIKNWLNDLPPISDKGD